MQCLLSVPRAFDKQNIGTFKYFMKRNVIYLIYIDSILIACCITVEMKYIVIYSKGNTEKLSDAVEVVISRHLPVLMCHPNFLKNMAKYVRRWVFSATPDGSFRDVLYCEGSIFLLLLSPVYHV